MSLDEFDEVNQDAAVAPKKKMTVDKGIYIGLCLLLGGLGAHKFYASKWIMGILYLLFCWTYVPTIIALIDFLIAAFQRSDESGQITV